MKGTFVSAIALFAVFGALSGCGSGVGGGGNGGGAISLTQAQAQQVGLSISDDLSNAFASALTSPAVPLDIGSRDHIRVGLQRTGASTAVIRPDAVTCSGSNCTISGTYTCPDSGSIQVSGDFSASGNSASGTLTETPSNCSDGTADISGDPSITVGLQGSDNGISTSVNVTISGGVSFSPVQVGQFPTGSCSCNLRLSGTLNDSSQAVTACSVTGTICGQNINVNCSNVP
jgi:hypothetical protein